MSTIQNKSAIFIQIDEDQVANCVDGMDSSNSKHTKMTGQSSTRTAQEEKNALIITIISFMLGSQQI